MHSKYFCFTVRFENIITWTSLVTTISTCCTSIIHLSEKFFFHDWAWKIFAVYIIRQTSLTVRLKNKILWGLSVTAIIHLKRKYLLFEIRLLWFWNHGMVHACLYVSCLCIYCFLHYELFIFLILIHIVIYSWLWYIVEMMLSSKKKFSVY